MDAPEANFSRLNRLRDRSKGARELRGGGSSEVRVDRLGRALAGHEGALDRGGVAMVTADEDAVPERDG